MGQYNFNLIDDNFKSFQKQQTKSRKTPQSVVCPNLSHSISTLKASAEDFKSFFDFKIAELQKTKKCLEKSEHKHLLNSAKVQETENLWVKYDREMSTLRDERVALEEVIASLRNESETLRASLNQVFKNFLKKLKIDGVAPFHLKIWTIA